MGQRPETTKASITGNVVITPELAAAETEREVVMRQLVYSKRVAEGRMTLAEAELKIAAMQEAARIVRLYAQRRREELEPRLL